MPTVTRLVAVIGLLLAFVGVSIGVGGTATAAGGLTITPIEWNVVGLDSNNPADGPHSFSNGVTVCNTGSTDVPDLVTTWVWDSANPAISLLGAASKPAVRLAAGTCRSVWYAVDVVPAAASFDQTRRFHVEASGTGVPSVSTPVPREIYVEHLVSQNRNSITAVSGATAVVVGQTYTYTVTGNTATNGYGQLVASPFFDPSIFEVLGVSETYGVGGPSSSFYSDACGWDPDPTSATYRSCVTPAANVGGTFTATVTVQVVGTGTTTMRSVVYDYSGSSYHYNSDFGLPTTALTVTATLPPATVTPSPTPTTTATATPNRTTPNRTHRPPSRSGGTPGRLPSTGPVGSSGLAAAGLLLVLTGGALIRYAGRRPAPGDRQDTRAVAPRLRPQFRRIGRLHQLVEVPGKILGPSDETELRPKIVGAGRARPPTWKVPGQRPRRGAACRSRTDDLRITRWRTVGPGWTSEVHLRRSERFAVACEPARTRVN